MQNGLSIEVRDLTRRYNMLLIADEVAVGFGRTGKMFASDWEDVAPDLLCLGPFFTVTPIRETPWHVQQPLPRSGSLPKKKPWMPLFSGPGPGDTMRA